MGPRFFSTRKKNLQAAACGACGESTPVGTQYCVWCGVHLEEAESFREHHEQSSTMVFDGPTESEWRPVLRRRRIRGSTAAAAALLAYEGLLGDIPGEVVLSSLADLPFLPLDYQMLAAQTVLGQMHGRAILADEVGLGKTIEAGLVVKELLVRKLCENVLILVPSSLVEQWKRELEEKFGLIAATHETPRFWTRPLLLLSLSRAKQGEVARRLRRRRFGLVMVDEAHSLKNARTVAHLFVRSLRTERLVLLTATPIENDLRTLQPSIPCRPRRLPVVSQVCSGFPGQPISSQGCCPAPGFLRSLHDSQSAQDRVSADAAQAPPPHSLQSSRGRG